jgi:hypothetical protein
LNEPSTKAAAVPFGLRRRFHLQLFDPPTIHRSHTMNATRTASMNLIASVALLAANLAQAADTDAMRSALEQSRDEKRGVTLVVGGRDVGLLVTEINGDYVLGKSQQYEKIVVRIDRIDAVLK